MTFVPPQMDVAIFSVLWVGGKQHCSPEVSVCVYPLTKKQEISCLFCIAKEFQTILLARTENLKCKSDVITVDYSSIA